MKKLFTHQKQSGKFLAKNPEVLDFSDPGTGKTAVHALDFQSRRKKCGKCVLVLAPKSLLKTAWANDFHTFAPDMTISIAYASNRSKAFAEKADVYVTNIDAATWLAQQPAKFFERFDQLIIDEGTAYKHHTSARSKAVAKISKYFKVRRLLTGTPIAGGITDIWHQALIVDGGKRLGKSFFAFRAATCTPTQVGPQPNMIKWKDKPGVENVVSTMLADIVIRHRFEECVDIPPNHRYSSKVELSTKHMALYKEMEEESFILMKKGTITAVNGAVRYGKLLQIASGAVYGDKDFEGEGPYHLLDSDRYEHVTDLVEARDHSLVAFLWRHQKEELERLFKARGITYEVIDGKTKDVDAVVQKYQAGWLQCLLCHPASAAHGLTLTRGTRTIFASPSPRLEWYLQFLKRIYRISQTQKTETITVLATGTLDEQVWDSQNERDAVQVDFLSLLERAK